MISGCSINCVITNFDIFDYFRIIRLRLKLGLTFNSKSNLGVNKENNNLYESFQ